jgi:preprotein translocase subunit YajC
LGNDVSDIPQSGYVIVAVMMLLFICMILPIMVMMYFDTIALQRKSERSEARIEKMLKIMEEKEKQ